MGLIDDIREGMYVPSEGGPPAVVHPRTSLAAIGVAVAAGAEPLPLVRDLLDEAQRAPDGVLPALMAAEPPLTGRDEVDALLPGIAEHLAATRAAATPLWTQAPERVLDRFWFVSEVPGFRAIALAQSPIALKRRGVMWSERSLERV